MIIHETGGVQGPLPVPPNRSIQPKPVAAASAQTARADRAEISDHARLLAKLREVEPVRQEKIDAIRAQIEAGTYETEDKLQASIDRLLKDLL